MLFHRSATSSMVLALVCGLARVTNANIYPRQQEATGGVACGVHVCVNGTVNGDTTTYILSSRGVSSVGWMGMGFGNEMPNTPMVIMWTNSDGTVTLSQRKASGHVMPTVDQNPPRAASFDQTLSVFSTSTPVFAFTIPSTSDKVFELIYAMGSTNPGSSAVDARLIQHVDNGVIRIDLSKSISSSGTTSSSDGSGESSATPVSTSSLDNPFLPYQKIIIAHAVMCGLGFLIFLPIGALLARYMRTFVAGPIWFRSHAILQFAIAGPMILTGFILGVTAVNKSGSMHLNDTHKRLGIALFVLYLFQCTLGALIHWVKKAKRTQRPPQNYAHAIVGLLIIALAGYQVHLGYDYEWPTMTGRGNAPRGVNIFFWTWIAVLIAAYVAGLAFLPKQYRQERQGVTRASHKEDESPNLK